ncbi:MAG: molybdopterin converting factor subunit 1 [Magnetococcales bacterium]|nr:molybdopterin converting factor subunit 1 [Magnetococcales bacterium]
MTHIFYFAWVREKIGTPEERISLPAQVDTVDRLLHFLRGRGEPYASALADPQLRVAVNQCHAQLQDTLKDGDEVAIFPPVSGG